MDWVMTAMTRGRSSGCTVSLVPHCFSSSSVRPQYSRTWLLTSSTSPAGVKVATKPGIRSTIERESRLIVDRIPGLVATLTPAGEVEDVNNQVLEYCGRTLEELKQWGTSDTVHPEDLPRANEAVSRSMALGDP